MHKNNKLHITLTEQIKNALQYWLRFDNVKYYDDFSKNTINAVFIFLRGIFSVISIFSNNDCPDSFLRIFNLFGGSVLYICVCMHSDWLSLE